MIRISILASGSGSNAENIVRFFADKPDFLISKIYTNNPEAFVIQRAAALNVPCEVFTRKDWNEQVVLGHLLKDGTDWIILAGFLWLIPEHIIQHFPDRIINIHPALLPKYGGKGMFGHHVHEAVIHNREIYSGITIHLVNEHYDQGEILFQETCSISPGETADSLAEKVHELEYRYFPEVIFQTIQKINI